MGMIVGGHGNNNFILFRKAQQVRPHDQLIRVQGMAAHGNVFTDIMQDRRRPQQQPAMLVHAVFFPDFIEDHQRQLFHLGHVLVVIFIIFSHMMDEAHHFLFQRMCVVFVFLPDQPQQDHAVQKRIVRDNDFLGRRRQIQQLFVQQHHRQHQFGLRFRQVIGLQNLRQVQLAHLVKKLAELFRRDPLHIIFIANAHYL